MKNLFLSVMVLATLASCGSDNKVSSGTTTSSTSPSTTTTTSGGITITDATGIALGSKVDNYDSQFGTGAVYYRGYQETFARLVSVGVPLTYYYTKSTQSTSSSNVSCDKKWIFTVCKSVSSSSSTYVPLTVSTKVYSTEISAASKIAELKAIINSANPLLPIQVSGTVYFIQSLSGNKSYLIDTSLPLQANPVAVKVGSTTEYLFSITETK